MYKTNILNENQFEKQIFTNLSLNSRKRQDSQIYSNIKATDNNIEPRMNKLLFSFTDLPDKNQHKVYQFCQQMQRLNLVCSNSVKVTDPNVLMVNSNDKMMAQEIYAENEKKRDIKSQQLTERIQKYLNVLQTVNKFTNYEKIQQNNRNKIKFQSQKPIKKIQIFIDDLLDSHKIDESKIQLKWNKLKKQQLLTRLQSQKNHTRYKSTQSSCQKNNNQKLKRTFDKQKSYLKTNSNTKIFRNINITPKKLQPKHSIKKKNQQDRYKINKRIDTNHRQRNKKKGGDKSKDITWNTLQCTRSFNRMLKMMKYAQNQ